MGNATNTEFTVIFNYAEKQLPIAKAGLAEADIPYEIVEQEWLSSDKSRAKVTFSTNSKDDAKRLREAIPVQRGLQCGCFVAAEYSEEARLIVLDFKKKALELGYSKYGVDTVCYRMRLWEDPSIWKTVTREELKIMPGFNKYKKGVDIVLGVQKGKKCTKKATWRNGAKKHDGGEGEIKDKLYHLSKLSGIPKGYLHLVLDVSETTLRKWSYNPANVSEGMSELIFKRIAYMDLARLHMELLDGERLPNRYSGTFLSATPSATEYMYRVQTGTSEVLTQDFYPVLRNALCWIEERGSDYLANYSESNVDAVRKGQRCEYVCPMGYSRIARDKSLEMPPGVLKWDEKLLKR